ncbi:MAG TPA: transglycosylase SLT domain-containing protein [Rhodanobacteraceae bacterium]|nr:transglycosylase SLT domain-containing protein [Rhodanobacteraceae bacterium]
MSSSKKWPQVRPLRMLAVVLLALLSACSGAPARKGAGNSTLDELYAKLDQASRDYDQALTLARRDDNAQAEHAISVALDAMRNGAAQCVNTPGCDIQRFISSYDRALRLKDGSFLGGDEGDELSDQPDTTNAGEGTSPVLSAVPQTQRSVSLLGGQKLSDLIAMNGPVKAALETWLTRMRPNLMQAYVDYQYLRFEMWPEYQKAGLPEAILFGILAKESGGKVHAVSRSGAAGPLQFMPATGARFGLTTVDGFDQRFDPALSARANAEYLDEQLAQFNNNLELVLAAYNGGEGRIGRLAATQPNASFWDPQVYFSLSPETRDYVPMVLAAAWLFMHPDRYNLHFPELDGAPGHVILQRPASLSELAVCLGQDGGARAGWFRTLRNLNPQLDPQVQEPMGARVELPEKLQGAYAQSCVSGPWVALASDLHSAVLPTPPPQIAQAAPLSEPRRYTVRRGDTLSSIARKFDCDNAHALAKANHLHWPHYSLRPGQELTLAGCGKD